VASVPDLRLIAVGDSAASCRLEYTDQAVLVRCSPEVGSIAAGQSSRAVAAREEKGNTVGHVGLVVGRAAAAAAGGNIVVLDVLEEVLKGENTVAGLTRGGLHLTWPLYRCGSWDSHREHREHRDARCRVHSSLAVQFCGRPDCVLLEADDK
jgi:hypothetical protein